MAAPSTARSSLAPKNSIPGLPNKKIPENPKYKSVKSKIDTGSSLSSYMTKMEQMHACYKYRKDEIFRRLKCTTFTQLILQIVEDHDKEISGEDETTHPEQQNDSDNVNNKSIDSPEDECTPPKLASSRSSMSSRNTLCDLVMGKGSMENLSLNPNSNKECASPDDVNPMLVPLEIKNPPYLLLDVREPEDYDKCHIISAMSYPSAMLHRSCNYFSRDIIEYKNQVGKIIIIYDMDESIAPKVTTRFIEKGVDNVFMLSGGMRVLYKVFSEGGVLSGILPESMLQPLPGEIDKTSPSKLAAGKKPNSNNKSVVRDQGPHKSWFTRQDAQLIQSQLENRLLETAGGSSSRSSTSGSRAFSVPPSAPMGGASRPASNANSNPNWKY